MIRIVLAMIVLVSSQPLASAEPEVEADTRDGDRAVFVAGLAATGVGLTLWGVAGFKVRSAEDDLDAIGPAVAAENEIAGSHAFDVCAAAEDGDGAASAEARGTCRRGDRWAMIGQIALIGTVASAAVTAYAGYRTFRARPRRRAERSAWRLAPSVGSSAAGLAIDLDF